MHECTPRRRHASFAFACSLSAALPPHARWRATRRFGCLALPAAQNDAAPYMYRRTNRPSLQSVRVHRLPRIWRRTCPDFLLLLIIILVQPSNEKDAKLTQKLGLLQPFALYSRRNAWANLYISDQPKTFLAMVSRSSAKAVVFGVR